MNHKLIKTLVAVLAVLLSSCAGSDYVNTIPDGSTALMSVDMAQAAKEADLGVKANVMMSLLKVSDPGDCGIDFSRKLYLFVAPDGNLGMAARVSSESDLTEWLGRLAEKHLAQPVTERRGYHFSVVKGSWVMGYSGKSVLLMGPVASNGQASLMAQMAGYLGQGEDEGIKGSPLFEKLDSIDGGMAMVARVEALPRQLAPLFMLGAPKEADESQVLIAARMAVADGCLRVEGEQFAFNRSIEAAIEANHRLMRPIAGSLSFDSRAQVAVMLNVKGSDFLPVIRQNKSLQALLAGANTVIDMDNIIRSIDGDMAIVADRVAADGGGLPGMGAELANTDFLGDVGYWKESCPRGSTISNFSLGRQSQSYRYSTGTSDYYFGVAEGAKPLFFSGSTIAQAEGFLPTATAGDASRRWPSAVAGSRMGVVVDFQAVDNETVRLATTLLAPLFGRFSAIVYTMK